MDPDSEGDKEGEGGVGGNEGNGDTDDAKEKDAGRSFVLIFLGEEDEGALASSSLISRKCFDESGSGVVIQTKIISRIMTNSLPVETMYVVRGAFLGPKNTHLRPKTENTKNELVIDLHLQILMSFPKLVSE